MKCVFVDDIHSISDQITPSVGCIGYFDGLHKGHQALIQAAVALAREKGMISSLITFNPDPWLVLKQKTAVNHITPLVEKTRLVEAYGIDQLIVIRFSMELASLSPMAFIETLLKPLKIEGLVSGSDFHFGAKGKGDPKLLQEVYGEDFKMIDLLEDDLGKISSTQIIQNILKGDMGLVSAELARDYCLSGEVVHGRKQGRKIGFPTANLQLVGEYVLPKPGVYAGMAEVDGKKYQSIVNIGTNPTFNTVDKLAIETHLLDFSEEIYGKVVRQSFAVRIRDELKFNAIDELVTQMKEDEAFARLILTETHHQF